MPLPASYLRGIAEELLPLYVTGERAQVAVLGAGIADTRAKAAGEARSDRAILVAVLELALVRRLALDPAAVHVLARRLVVLDGDDRRAAVRVCGSELAGIEDVQTATHRARSMRDVLVAELQRALSDEAPVTSRRGGK